MAGARREPQVHGVELAARTQQQVTLLDLLAHGADVLVLHQGSGGGGVLQGVALHGPASVLGVLGDVSGGVRRHHVTAVGLQHGTGSIGNGVPGVHVGGLPGVQLHHGQHALVRGQGQQQPLVGLGGLRGADPPRALAGHRPAVRGGRGVVGDRHLCGHGFREGLLEALRERQEDVGQRLGHAVRDAAGLVPGRPVRGRFAGLAVLRLLVVLVGGGIVRVRKSGHLVSSAC